MTDTLPANRKRGLRDALYMIQIKGLESVTRALIMGDGFDDVENLNVLANRCRALANAYDARVTEIKEDT